MSTSLLIVAFVVLIACGYVTSALTLWGICRVFRIKDATLVRAVIASFLMIVPTLAVCGAWLLVLTLIRNENKDPNGLEASIALGIVLLASVLLPIIIVQRWMKTRFAIAVGIYVMMVVIGSVPQFGLAWLFRSTCAEAFVNPTGGMAPTMFGAHISHTCESCGWTYIVGASYRNQGERPAWGERRESRCENCGHSMALTNDEPLLSGDRFVVDKTAHPNRWDIAVFHIRPESPRGFGEEEQPRQKYVQRLVGLPNETVAIRQGDVFINETRLAKPLDVASDLWLYVHETSRTAAFQSADSFGWKPAGEAIWNREADGGWSYHAASEERQELRFSNGITDANPYNHTSWGDSPTRPVRDVRLTCEIESLIGDGDIEFSRRFHDLVLKTTISARGDVLISVERLAGEAEPIKVVTSEPTPLKYPVAQSTLCFAIRDGHAYVMQSDELVASVCFCEGEKLPDVLPFPHDAANQVSIFARDCQLRLRRIQLDRDVHYLSLDEMDAGRFRMDTDRAGRKLGEDEYFMLGDNSPSSSDTRFHRDATNEDELIGVARWCYWPLSRRREFK